MLFQKISGDLIILCMLTWMICFQLLEVRTPQHSLARAQVGFWTSQIYHSSINYSHSPFVSTLYQFEAALYFCCMLPPYFEWSHPLNWAMSHSSEFSIATIYMWLYSCLYRCILFYSPCGNTALIHLRILLRADQAPHSHDIPCCFCCKMLMRSFNVGVYWVLSIMPNILEILVKSQMEKSISVQCKLNIRNHL